MIEDVDSKSKDDDTEEDLKYDLRIFDNEEWIYQRIHLLQLLRIHQQNTHNGDEYKEFLVQMTESLLNKVKSNCEDFMEKNDDKQVQQRNTELSETFTFHFGLVKEVNI